MLPNLQNIAEQLAAARQARALSQTTLANKNALIEIIKASTMPTTGWPGSNPEQRKAAEQKALTTHPDYEQIKAEAMRAENEIVLAQAKIDGLEDMRRAVEWEIRQSLAAALGYNRIPQAHADRSVGPENTAFDDATQAAVDNKAFQKAGEAPRPFRTPPPPPPATFDKATSTDIPF